MPLTTGLILNNRYRIVRLLGEGGFGAVYRAWDINLQLPCALKENYETSPNAVRQFLREAQILHALRHPNLPQVKDHFIIPDQGQYLVMDFVEGEDLEELRARSGGIIPAELVLNWSLQILEALHHIHNQEQPVVHRDIKPANIKITKDPLYPHGKAILVDFGIAKVYDPKSRTTAGARAVTPGYSPFEQYGSAPTDARTDIYSLAATMYTLLTGQEPPESISRIAGTELIPPRAQNPSISLELEKVLLTAINVLPGDRYQSAYEFKQALGSFAVPPAMPATQIPQPIPTIFSPSASTKSPVHPNLSPAPTPRVVNPPLIPPPVYSTTPLSIKEGGGKSKEIMLPAKWVITVGVVILLLLGIPLTIFGISRFSSLTNPTATHTLVEVASSLPSATAPLTMPTAIPSATLEPTATLIPPSATPSASPTHTLIPTNTPTRMIYRVVVCVRSAYVRSGPGTVYPILESYPEGTELIALGRNIDASWLVVDIPGSIDGWISEITVCYDFDAFDLPFVTSPPTPIPPPTSTPTEEPRYP